MDATAIWLQQQVRAFEQRCAAAAIRVRMAKTMGEVTRAVPVPIHACLRGVQHTLPAYRTLRQVAKQRMGALLDAHLAELQQEPTEEAFKAHYGRLQTRDWLSLRGDYSDLLHRAETESARIRFQLTKAV